MRDHLEGLAAAIDQALAVLPSRLREAFVMRAVEGRSTEEVAELLEVSKTTVSRRERSAKEALSVLLAETGLWADDAAFQPLEVVTDGLELVVATRARGSRRRQVSPAEFRLNASAVVCDPRILQYFDGHPEAMRDLSPRDFERFVASLMERFGYSVELGPPGADGGVDIHAKQVLPTGPEYVLVQCKRHNARRKVTMPVIKQLRADVFERRASRGLVVTTSWFTRSALSYIAAGEYTLAKKDFDDLRYWLSCLVSNMGRPRITIPGELPAR